MANHGWHRLGGAMVVSLLCAACTAAPEVRELAKTTASNASLANTKLAGLAKSAKQIAARRVEIAAELSGNVAQLQGKYDTFRESARAAAKMGGEEKKPNFFVLIDELQNVTETVASGRDSVAGRSAAIEQEILASQAQLDIPRDQLSLIARKAGALSQAPDRTAQLAFLKAFFQEIVSDIKEAKESADDSAKDAQEKAKDANKGAVDAVGGGADAEF